MSHADFWDLVERIRAGDGRFARDAYAFVMDGLDDTVRALPQRRHVSGPELVHGLCRFARRRYGMLAFAVLERWGIRCTADIGAIVFQLVDAGILSRRDEDAIGDFDSVVDLREALEERYFEDDIQAPPAL